MTVQVAPRSKLGLVLPGGGARAAYQAGVLKAIAEMLPAGHPNPFAVISGTSAGAINAALIATKAQHFQAGAEHLAGVWENIHSNHVFKSDTLTVLKSGLHWLLTMLSAGLDRHNPISLLDNSPLRRLIEEHVIFDHLQQGIDAGALDALAITCSGYTSARAICFYQGKHGIKPWHRTRRLGQPARLRIDHVMASAALPVIFPAVRLGREYFGDGSLRQAAPLSPAVHLGAERILVIGVRNEQPNPLPGDGENVPYPSLGQIAGYLLDVVFSDSIYGDLERLERINATISLMSKQEFVEQPLRFIDTLVVVPSKDIREIAQNHKREFPRSVRALFSGVGGLRRSGSQLLSYLLFEAGYCRELVELGRRDGLAQAKKVLEFIDGKPALLRPGRV